MTSWDALCLAASVKCMGPCKKDRPFLKDWPLLEELGSVNFMVLGRL